MRGVACDSRAQPVKLTVKIGKHPCLFIPASVFGKKVALGANDTHHHNHKMEKLLHSLRPFLPAAPVVLLSTVVNDRQSVPNVSQIKKSSR